MTLVSSRAQAYVNFGRWIADCPLGCGSAKALEPNQSGYYCDPPHGCGYIGTVDWPDNADDIWNTLMERPMPKTRNWFPKNHDLALRSNSEHGQTVKQLREEAKKNGVS